MRYATASAALLAYASALMFLADAKASPLTSGTIPIAIFWQRPQLTVCSGYSNCAQAAAAADIDIFLGLGSGGVGWPESCGATPTDLGEWAAITGAGMYAVAPISVTWYSNDIAGPNTAKCAKAFVAQRGGAVNFLGMDVVDEPQDEVQSNPPVPPLPPVPPSVANVPSAVSQVASYDNNPKHVYFVNMTAWWTYIRGDAAIWDAAQKAGYASSFDDYAMTGRSHAASGPYADCMGAGDYNTVPNDCFVLTSTDMQLSISHAAAGQPVWAIPEDGGDEELSGQNHSNDIQNATISANTLTLNSGGPSMGPAWVGLSVTGNGVTNATIQSVIDAMHATLSTNGSGTGTVTITGGAPVEGGGTSDCVESTNICVVSGTEWRATPSQVNAEVFSYLIEGATGFTWFCHDSGTSLGYGDTICLNSTAYNGAASTTIFNNITYVDTTVKSFAKIFTSGHFGQCSTASWDPVAYQLKLALSCSFTDGNGNNWTLTTPSANLPAHMIVKNYNSHQYVFVQPLSRAASTAGTQLTVTYTGTVTGLTVKYDSNGHYDPSKALKVGSSVPISSGSWNEIYGANGDDYQAIAFMVTP